MFEKSNYHFAIDCDEVLVHISKKWTDIVVNDPIISQYIFDTSTLEEQKNFISFKKSLVDNVLLRERYYLNEYLRLDNPEIRKRYLDLYNLNGTFYDNLEPSKYYESLVKIIKGPSILTDISIITSVGETEDFPCVLSKKKFLYKLFKNFSDVCNINFYFVTDGIKKSDIINSNNIQYTTFIDDHMSNIEDVIINTNSKHKDFSIPLYGYNKKLDIIGIDNPEIIVEHFGISDLYYFEN